MTNSTQDTELIPVYEDKEIADETINSAILLYESKSYSKALDLLMSNVEHDKTGTSANLIANCYLKLGSTNDAIRFLQKAITQNPTCYKAFLSLGNINYAQNNINQALIHWHIALSIRPENAQINYNLATGYSRINERLEAIHYYEKFLKYCEKIDGHDFKTVTKMIIEIRNRASIQLKKASAAISENEANAAVQYYVKALKNYPLLPKVIQNIAKIFLLDRNFSKAIEYYKLALETDDKLKICLVDIGNAYIAKKEYEMAYCYFKKFLLSYTSQQKTFFEIERICAYAQSKMDEKYDSRKHYDLAVEYEKKLKYKKALDEYENYYLLTENDDDNNKEQVKESIKKLKLIIHPERTIINNLIEKITELESNDKKEEAIPLCDRIVVLAVLNSHAYQWANRKKQDLKYAIFKANGKK